MRPPIAAGPMQRQFSVLTQSAGTAAAAGAGGAGCALQVGELLVQLGDLAFEVGDLLLAGLLFAPNARRREQQPSTSPENAARPDVSMHDHGPPCWSAGLE